MSISDEIRGLQAANLKAGEVAAALENATDLMKAATDGLQECIVLQSAVLGEHANGIIADALGLFMEAQTRLANNTHAMELIKNYVAVSLEKNDEMIGRLSS